MKQLQKAIGMRLALALTGLSVPSLKREEGQTFVEYALILAFIAILMILALTFLRGKIASLYSHVGNSL
jgi:Flp pilus assembly pilin Flp